jgi:taurine---2-oxoglutarate transaminase
MEAGKGTIGATSELSHDEARQMERDYVLHSWCVQGQYSAPTVVGGSGSTFWDMDGKRYLDFASQAICNNLGHQHPRVVEAIQRQAGELCFVQGAWGSRPRALLACRIAQVAPPNLVKTFFTNGGAEANENAIKMARWFTGRSKIITRYRSYHGASAGAMSLSGDPRRWAAEPGIPGIVRALDAYCYRCSFGLKYPDCGLRCAEHIGELIEMEGPKQVAAVLVEPITGTNGILVPPEGYLQRLREICSRYGTLLICDEVMTGFGRTGKWFASQHWDVAPDIMVIAKGLTAATIPLGGVVISREIADYFEDKPLVAGLTYLGHPLACAAGLAALDVYVEEGLIERSQKLGDHMLSRLRGIEERHPSVGEVRGKGLFAAVELVKNRETREPLAAFNSNSPAIGRIVKQGKQRGVVFMSHWNVVILAPPLVITQEELDYGLNVLDELLVEADGDVI